MSADELKELVFIASARDDLRAFPDDVKSVMGFALREAQRGGKGDRAKALKGFGGAGVLEVIDDYDGDTYRTVYTLKFAEVVYVLHAFQKKSKAGIGLPKRDTALIESRLKVAARHHEERKKMAT